MVLQFQLIETAAVKAYGFQTVVVYYPESSWHVRLLCGSALTLLAGQQYMTDHAVRPEWVTKIDVAERQLCEAVRCFFERRDPIIVHTLVAAGHQVLTDLGNASGMIGLLKGKNQPVEHVRSLNYAANFFKHADRDHRSRINIACLSGLTAEFLMDAVVMLQRFKGSIPIEAKVFWSWFVTKHQDLFEGSGEATQSLMDIGLDPDDFDAIVTLLKISDVLPPEAFAK